MPTSNELIGAKVIEFIVSNVEQKTDLNGKPFMPYSLGYWLRKKYKKKSKAKSKSGKAKFIATAKAAWEGDKANVNLIYSGAMLAALKITNIDKANNVITIGFSDGEAAKVAFYHNVSGAGKGRIIRRFFGVKKGDEAELHRFAGQVLGADKEFIIEALTPYLKE